MSKLTCTLLTLLAFATVPSWAAVTNAVVGTCRTGTTYTTIQSAINNAAAGSTVQVCPGTYPEVLSIAKSLTLKGVAAGNSNSVVITVPTSGVPSNGTSGLWGSLAAHVAVKGAAVHFSNITIDGSITGCPVGLMPVGIMFQGADGSSMTNSLLQNGSANCGNAMSAFIDVSDHVNFSNNTLRDCYRACIEVDYDAVGTTIKNNVMTSAVASGIGISTELLGGPTTISGNIIAGNFSVGIFSNSGAGLALTSNDIAPTTTAVGIVLNGAMHSTVQSNRVLAFYGIILDDQGVGTGNTVTKNTIVGGSCGLNLNTANQGDTTAPNTFAEQASNVCTFSGV